MGFSNIYERKINDLVTGWIKKNGSVEEVLVEINDKKIPINKNQLEVLFIVTSQGNKHCFPSCTAMPSDCIEQCQHTLANAPLLTALKRGQSSIYLYILILSYIIYKII